jgi:hypothetical protein
MLIVIAGFAALCVGFWFIYVTARSGGLGIWLLGAFLFTAGTIASVIGGIWSCIVLADHASFSFGSFGVSAARCSRGELRLVQFCAGPHRLCQVQQTKLKSEQGSA